MSNKLQFLKDYLENLNRATPEEKKEAAKLSFCVMVIIILSSVIMPLIGGNL